MSLWRIMVKTLDEENKPLRPSDFLCYASDNTHVYRSFKYACALGLVESLPKYQYQITNLGREWVRGTIEDFVPFRQTKTKGRADNTKVAIRATWLRALPMDISINPPVVLL